jgi:hypothetical protein
MIRLRDKADRSEEVALSIFLFLCFLLAFMKDLFPVLDKGLSAAVFAAIFFVLKQIHDLRLEVQSSGTREQFFATNEEFYSSARDEVRRANREIRVTYFRSAPPTKIASRESREYFEEVIKFTHNKGTVRRIIGVSNKSLAEWCVSQAEQVNRNPRYNVRVIVTANQAVEPMSACLIDDEVMFMAFSGPTDQQLGGIRVASPKLVQFHQNRFDQLWAAGSDLLHFVNSPEFELNFK